MRVLNPHFEVTANAIDTLYDIDWLAPRGGFILDLMEVGSTIGSGSAMVMFQLRRGVHGSMFKTGQINTGFGLDNHMMASPGYKLDVGDIIRCKILYPTAGNVYSLDLMLHSEGG